MKKVADVTPVICLMGPTASGKTDLSLELAAHFPLEIISVDSAMVYRGMDIGTAKPNQAILRTFPHHLIDIADPEEIYSAGRFYQDAIATMAIITQQGKIPFLVGGTMLYFRMLQLGMATLPKADETVRLSLQARAKKEGWDALHAYLNTVDPLAASRIHVHDEKRILRALEVFELTGKNISTWQREDTSPLANYHFHYLALFPTDRHRLHERIALRFKHMLAQGFIEEVTALYQRQTLHPNLPAIRSVGYRQIWSYLASELTATEMEEQAIAATRQLAKRQLTWLRSWPALLRIDADAGVNAAKNAAASLVLDVLASMK